MPDPESLQDAVEAHLAATLTGGGEATPRLITLLRGTIESGDPVEAAAALRAAAVPGIDYTTAQSLARLQRRLTARWPPAGKPLRVALLANQTSDQLAAFLELFLFAAGLSIELYRPDYGVLRQEILDPGSGLYRHAPRFVFLATSWRDLGPPPGLAATAAEAAGAIDREFAGWAALWEKAHAGLGCQILQNNFDAPAWRQADNLEMRLPGSLGGFIAGMNRAFAERAPAHVTVHDLAHLAASAGLWSWGEERFFHHAKLPAAPESLVDYAHSAASLLAAQAGVGRKALVLDLDNTLWGGVVGDDGLPGLRLGQGDGEGEAYQAFQRFAKGLAERGVLLAVCSKNDETIAREVFEKHTEMILRLDDIACFVANWQDKATNLRAIAARLNIGLNSLVFVDDNPAERSIVRRLAPEVAVPEMPADVSGYVRAVQAHRWFQAVSLGSEDLGRTAMYRANASRDAAEAASGSVDDFLRTLRMVAQVRPVDAQSLERVTQLVNRSNQFNLTTRRYSAGEIQARAADPAWVTRTITLGDRFGDNGLISVLLAQAADGVLVIDTWVMSCRVLKRGVEELALNCLVEAARERGLVAVRGQYLATAKNGLVRDHYRDLGFTPPDGDAGFWELRVADATPRPVHIVVA
ncbi:MAG TPA: HAD-IIIC family phosphatase [Candidatus Polarisedimenticolia bacterium]|nr:HAD-IIIC family phosphatase [Candidatus Polarisedimenticolia bacterium]